MRLNFIQQREKASLKIIPKFIAAWLCAQVFAYIVNLKSHVSKEIEWKGHKFSLGCLLKTESLDTTKSRYF